VRHTPLESWIASKIGAARASELTRDALGRYQLARLQETCAYAREKSHFYRRRLDGCSALGLNRLEDLAAFPFTTPQDIVTNGHQFLCVSQSEIERVVTLQAPGSADRPRRISFTSDDLELTRDFFRVGMSTFVEPGQKVLILMPGDRPGSVGALLKEALARMDVEGILHGLVQDPETAVRDILRHEIDCLVGIPAQVLSMARCALAREIPTGRIKSILLSSDYVPSPIVRELRRVWNCPTFNHYGTTEMGLGGGVECAALSGYHLREADLYFEIVDPDSGEHQPVDVPGEIVFTTLTRKGMPLIRYRTGDLASFVSDPCACGTMLRKMGTVRGRLHEMVRLRTGDWLGIPDLDEVLFSLSGIVNYAATFSRHKDADSLEIAIYPGPRRDLPDEESVESALLAVPQIGTAVNEGRLRLKPSRVNAENWITTSAAKRALVLREVEEE
jgi:phenylacetate-CoA ligase